MDILEVLSALEGSPIPMEVSLLCEEGSGEIFDRARILHAHVEGKEGPLEAMAAMIAWSSSRFLVRPAHQQFPNHSVEQTVVRVLHGLDEIDPPGNHTGYQAG